MATRLTTSTPTEMRSSLRDHHGSLAFPPFLHQLFNAPHLMMRLCRFPAASSCVPQPSLPLLSCFLTSYHGVITKLIMINFLLFCYLPSYLAILTHILSVHKALHTLSGRLSLHSNSRSSKRNVRQQATLLVFYSDILLTPFGHSEQRLKLKILIKARL